MGEAFSKDLIKAWDAPPRSAAPKYPAAFVEIQEYSNASQSWAKTSFCPNMKGKNGLCVEKPCDIRNLVYITCVNAQKLPSQTFDKIDPYVWFWVENKDNVASTPEFRNNENPHFSWGCPFAYDGALNFDGEVWDSDIGRDDLVGEIASSGGIKIDENFLETFDKDGDGRFELGLYIFKNGKKVKHSRKGLHSIVRFRFELIKAPGYELRRVDSHGGSHSLDSNSIGGNSGSHSLGSTSIGEHTRLEDPMQWHR